MSRYIKDMINRGEGQQLDFKYCISDSRKIAKTLSAFANSSGGTLLIGVKDNGSITGVRDDEEAYMIDTAARLFCKPEIEYEIAQHTAEGKSILEVRVKKGKRRPYKAKGEDGVWRPYARQNDQNLVAGRVLTDVWIRESRKRPVFISFSEPERLIMQYLRENSGITLSGFRRLAGISSSRARNILVNMILCNTISIKLDEKGASFTLPEEDSARGASLPDWQK